MSGDALALLELDSVARGYRALDALVKRAPVQLLDANLIEPGRYLILFAGGVAEVEEAYAAGVEIAERHLVDHLMLPWAHPSIAPALSGRVLTEAPDTVGIVEANAVASALLACDRAVKDAAVRLRGLRVTPALGGKAYFVVQGEQADVEAAVLVSEAVLSARGQLQRVEVIARPHEEFLAWVLRPAPFTGGS